MSLRLAVQAKLVEEAKDGCFPIVTYASDGSPNPIDETVLAGPLLPITCNETGCEFTEDENNRRGDFQQRVGWTFSLRMRFNSEVLLEMFEEVMMEDPPFIPSANGYPSVTLRLTGTEPQHPPQQEASNGTSVEFTFEAIQGRR